MADNTDTVKTVGVASGIAGALSLAFLPALSLLRGAPGWRIVAEGFESNDSGDVLTAFLVIAIFACGVIGSILYSMGKTRDGAGAGWFGIGGYIVGIFALVVGFETIEAIQLVGFGAWLSIICYLAMALAPRLGPLMAVGQVERRADSAGMVIDDPKLAADEEILTSQLADDPLNVELLIKHADVLLRVRNLREAAKECEKALSVDEMNFPARATLTSVYSEMAEDERAGTHLQLLSELSPADTQQVLNLARLQETVGADPKGAANTLRKGLGSFPGDSQLLAASAQVLLRMNDAEQALEMGQSALEADPDNAGLLEELAHFALANGRYSEAYELFARLTHLKPDSSKAKLYAVIGELAAADVQDDKRVMSIAERLKEFHQDDLEAFDRKQFLFASALVAFSLNQTTRYQRKSVVQTAVADKALYKTWQRFIDALLAKELVRLKEDIGGFESALNELTELYDATESSPLRSLLSDASYDLGSTLEAKKDWKNAITYYRKAAELSDSKQHLEALERVQASQKRRRGVIRFVVITVTVVLALVAVVLIFGRGRVHIAVTPAATVSVEKGGEPVFVHSPLDTDSASEVSTPWLFLGDYSLHVTRPGFTTHEQKVSIGFGRQTISLSQMLLPLYGGLRVDSRPSRARVLIDGELAGLTPLVRDSLLAKPTLVRIEKNDYTPYEATHELVSDSMIDLGVVHFEGELTLDSKPSGALVYVDGRQVGQTPLTKYRLPAKTVSLRVEKPGEAVYENASLVIAPELEVQLNTVNLAPAGALRITGTPDGARVFLDGKSIGRLPVLAPTVGEASYTIRVLQDYYETEELATQVVSAKVTSTSVRLRQFHGNWETKLAQYDRYTGTVTVEGLATRPKGEWNEKRWGFMDIQQEGPELTIAIRDKYWEETEHRIKTTVIQGKYRKPRYFDRLPWSRNCTFDDNSGFWFQVDTTLQKRRRGSAFDHASGVRWIISAYITKDGKFLIGKRTIQVTNWFSGEVSNTTYPFYAIRRD